MSIMITPITMHCMIIRLVHEFAHGLENNYQDYKCGMQVAGNTTSVSINTQND